MYSNVKFHENSVQWAFSAVPCGQTGMAELKVAILRTRLKNYSKSYDNELLTLLRDS